MPSAVVVNARCRPNLVIATAQPMKHGRSMDLITWFSETQGMVIGVAEHRIADHHHVVCNVGDARRLPLTDGQDLMFNRPLGWRFIHPVNGSLDKGGKKWLQHREATRRIGGQPNVHASSTSERVMVVAPMMNEGDIEELEGTPRNE